METSVTVSGKVSALLCETSQANATSFRAAFSSSSHPPNALLPPSLSRPPSPQRCLLHRRSFSTLHAHITYSSSYHLPARLYFSSLPLFPAPSAGHISLVLIATKLLSHPPQNRKPLSLICSSASEARALQFLRGPESTDRRPETPYYPPKSQRSSRSPQAL